MKVDFMSQGIKYFLWTLQALNDKIQLNDKRKSEFGDLFAISTN